MGRRKVKTYVLYNFAKKASREAGYFHKPKWKKKWKLLALVSVLGVVFAGGAALWGAASLIGAVTNSMNAGVFQKEVKKGEQALSAMTAKPITSKACLDQVFSLLSPEKILTVPLAENFHALRSLCWQQAPGRDTTES